MSQICTFRELEPGDVLLGKEHRSGDGSIERFENGTKIKIRRVTFGARGGKERVNVHPETIARMVERPERLCERANTAEEREGAV